MSTTIDNRVVKMTFDNAQFEKAIKNTIKTLDDFEKKLDMKGATAGFSKIGEAADKLNLSPLAAKADKIKEKFNEFGKQVSDSFSTITNSANNTDLSGISENAQKAMSQTQDAVDGLDTNSIVTETSQASEGFNAFSVVAIGALMAVGEQIETFVSGGLNKIVSGLTGLADKAILQPIKDGLAEYQTQIGAIQTIIANTGRDFHSSADIAEVNSALDTLNTYADKTIYNFTEMTRNIGTFTAAGVSMEDAVPAIQGIANMAALSGSTSQQASTAMYQLSQALSAGTVKLMDWNSVVNAGMGGKVFQEKLIETAYHIHGANGELEKYGGTLDAVKNGSLSFRDSLQEEWITSDVLTEALQQMTYAKDDMTEAEKRAATARLESLGYTEQEIEDIFKLGQTAAESATKVRTWTQLWDTVGESLGSGWAVTWRTILGDFKDATNLFTYLSKQITGVIDTISDARNAVVEGWAVFGGRDFLFGSWIDDPDGGLPTLKMNGALQNFVDMLKGWAEPMSAAFEDIFDFFNEGFDIDPKTYNADFARVLKKGGDDVIQYRNEYLEQFEQGTVEYQEAINELNHTEELFKQGVFDGFDPKTLLWDEVGQSLASVTEGFNNLTASLVPSETMMNGLYGIFGGLFSIIQTVATAVGALITGFSGLVSVARILIDPLIDIVFTIGGAAGRIIAEVMNYVTDLINSLVEFGDKVLGWVKPALKGLVDGFFGILNISGKIEGFTGVVLNLIRTIWGLLDIPGKLSSIADAIKGAFDWIFKSLGLINDDVGENAKTWDNLGQRIINRFTDMKNKIVETIPFLGNIINWFKNLFDVFSSDNSDAMKEFITTHFESFKNKATEILKPLIDLGNAIKNFVTNAVKSFGELDIIKNTKKNFDDFINTITNKFGKLPRIFELVGTAVAGVFSGIGSGIDINGKINSLTEYFSNLTPQKAIDDIVNFGNNIKNTFGGIIDYFSNISVPKLGVDLFEKTTDGLLDFYDVLVSGSDKLKMLFPEYSNEINKGTNNIIQLIDGAYEGVYNILAPAFETSNSIPEFIVNIFKRIGNAINNGINGLLNTIMSIQIGDIFDFITTPFRKIMEWLESKFPGISKYLEPIKTAFDNLSTNLHESGTTIGDVIFKLFDTIGRIIEEHAPWIYDIIDKISDKMKSLPKSFTTAAKVISSALSHLPGFVGTIFGGISKVLTGFGITSKLTSDEMPETYQNMFGSMEGPAEEAGDTFFDFISKFDPASLPGTIKELGGAIIGKLKEELEKVKEYIKTLPGKLKNLVSSLVGDEGSFKEILDRINQIVQSGLTVAISKFVMDLGSTMKNLSKAIKAHESNDFSEKIRNIGLTLAALGGVVVILGNMKVEQVTQGTVVLGVLAILLGALTGISGHLAKSSKVDWTGGANGLKSSSTALLEIAAIVVILGKMSPEEIQKGIDSLTIIGIMLVALSALSGKISSVSSFDWKGGTKGIRDAATALLEVSLALLIMGPALSMLSGVFNGKDGNFDVEKLKSVGAALGVITALLVELGVLASKTKGADLQATAMALVVFGGAVAAMSLGLSILAGLDVGGIVAGGLAIAGLIVALGALVKMTQEADLITTSVALIIFGGAVGIMALGLSTIAGLDAGGLIASGVAIAGLLLALGLMVQLTQEADLITTSLALVVFSGAIIGLSYGLSMLAELDTGRLIGGAVALGILIAAVTAATYVLSNPEIAMFAAVILPLLALAFAAVGAAAFLIANGINIAVDALIRLAEAAPTLATFVETIASHLLEFGQAALAFAALGASMIVLGAGVGVLGGAGLIAAVGIGALTLALNGLLDVAQRAQEFMDAGHNITAGIGEGITGGLDLVTQAILGIGQGILSTILGFFGIASPSTVMAEQVGQYLPEGIATGIDDNSGGLMDSLGGTLEELLTRFSTWVQNEGLPKLQEFGNNILDKVRNEIIPNLLDWVQNEGIPRLGQMAQGVVDHLMQELGKLPGKLFEWASGIPGQIWNGIQSAWSTITSIGSDIINGIVSGIQSMPNAIADAVVGMASGGLDSIKHFFGIASPSKVMRNEVGRWIPAGLAAGITEYAKTAITAGIDFAKDVSQGINDNIDIVNPEMNFDYGTLTPVLDMNRIDSAIDNYSKQWSGLDFNAMSTNMQNIDANLDLTPMLRNTLDQTNQIGMLRNQNGELLNAITGLRNEIAEYNDIMSRMAIVMDTGTLVGALSSDIDNALGQRQVLAERGVY